MAAKRIVLTAALICVTAAGVLTGCGGSKDKDTKADDKPATPAASATTTTTPPPSAAPFVGLTPQQISDKAVDAMSGLSSVTVDFNGQDSGETMRMRAAMTNDGKCVSHIVLSGGNLELIGVGKEMYAKGDTKFWDVQGGGNGAAINDMLKGRWLRMPAGSEEEESFKSFCDLSTFMKSFTEDSGGKKTQGSPVEVAGRQAVPIVGPEDGGTTTVYVATQGAPYVLKAEHTGDDAGSVTFTDFDKPLKAVAPPASQTVDASKLGA